jgi:hypothetical protein
MPFAASLPTINNPSATCSIAVMAQEQPGRLGVAVYRRGGFAIQRLAFVTAVSLLASSAAPAAAQAVITNSGLCAQFPAIRGLHK